MENINEKSATNQTNQFGNSSTQLNQFLLKQLQDQQHTNNSLNEKSTGFVLPQLKCSSENKKAMKFELPILNQQLVKANISSLTNAINNLQVLENSNSFDIEEQQKSSKPADIDLTAALTPKSQRNQSTSSTKNCTESQQTNTKLDFEIPFIDCDRLDVSSKRIFTLPNSNEYCITDISQLLFPNSLVEPSAVGRFLCLDDNKYLPPLPLKYLTQKHREIVKHNIEPFNFESKSPDDLVLLALSKYQRRHYN